MSQINFTLEDIKELLDNRFVEERKHTRQLFVEERAHTQQLLVEERKHTQQLLVEERKHTQQLLVEERAHTQQIIKASADEVIGQFNSFIEHNFNAGLSSISRHFDVIEDHLDRIDIDGASLRTDVRHIKQALQTKHHTPGIHLAA